MFQEIIKKYFNNPKNVGKIKNADASGSVGSPVCGDVSTMYIKVEKGKIADISFETLGCAVAIAAASIATEIAKGKTLVEAKKIEVKDLLEKMGDIPPVKVHCLEMAIDTLKKTIEEYERKK